MMPKRWLPESAPMELDGHEVAAREWRRVVRLYASMDAEIVSRLDMAMLLDYCMLMEQLLELDELRKAAMDGWRAAQKVLDAFQGQKDDQDDGEKVDLKTWIKALEAVNWAYDKIVKLDGRADRKRALLLQLRQSLYLTPRSRAGVAPRPKGGEKKDDFGDEFD